MAARAQLRDGDLDRDSQLDGAMAALALRSDADPVVEREGQAKEVLADGKAEGRRILVHDCYGKTSMVRVAAGSVLDLKHALAERFGVPASLQLLTSTACSLLSDDTPFSPTELATVHLRVRCLGGKGGFGAMLRGQNTRPGMKAVVSNTGAMRDLSGKRLRHVEQEQQLEEWKAEEGARRMEKEEVLVRIHLIVVMIRWTGLAPWESAPLAHTHARTRVPRFSHGGVLYEEAAWPALEATQEQILSQSPTDAASSR